MGTGLNGLSCTGVATTTGEGEGAGAGVGLDLIADLVIREAVGMHTS